VVEEEVIVAGVEEAAVGGEEEEEGEEVARDEKRQLLQLVSELFSSCFYSLHRFSTDQSEAELLYFCSLFLPGATRSYLV
jgi:hypothetical protein